MTAPTEQDIASDVELVDSGINDPWVDLAMSPRHPDPVVAELENDRDRYYARGEWDYAQQAQAEALEMAHDVDRQLGF